MSIQLDVFLIEKRVWAMKSRFLLLNNVISILDLSNIDDKKILEIRNKNLNKLQRQYFYPLPPLQNPFLRPW